MPRSMNDIELYKCVNYVANALELKEKPSIRKDLAEQLRDVHVETSPLENIRHLKGL